MRAILFFCLFFNFFCGLINAQSIKIVSLAPSITEVVFALGLGNELIGVTTFSNYPYKARTLPKIGTYTHLNLEKIIQLDPDIIIGTYDGNREYDINILRKLGFYVYMTNPRNIKDTLNMIYHVAVVLGVPNKGKILKYQLENRIIKVINKVKFLKKVKVFFQINSKPIISVNKNTFQNDLIRLAGGINITENEPIRYPRISIEEVIYKKPEVIIISSMQKGGIFEKMRDEWLQWKSIPAVKNHRIYLVNSDIVDRASPRLVKGLEVIAHLLHPEVNWR